MNTLNKKYRLAILSIVLGVTFFMINQVTILSGLISEYHDPYSQTSVILLADPGDEGSSSKSNTEPPVKSAVKTLFPS